MPRSASKSRGHGGTGRVTPGLCLPPSMPGQASLGASRRFVETVELQISLKNYDPQKDKRFSGTVRFAILSLLPSLRPCPALLGAAAAPNRLGSPARPGPVGAAGRTLTLGLKT